MTNEERRSLLTRLIARIDRSTLADRVVDSYWTRRDPARLHEPRQHAELWTRWHIDLMARWLTEGQPPGETELETVRGRAREQAAAGISMASAAGSVRRATRFTWTVVLELADPDERLALLESVDVVGAYLDQITELYVSVHRENERTAPVSPDERCARGAIWRLCQNRPPVAEDVVLASRLGVRLEGLFHPTVIALTGPPAAHLRLAQQLRGSETIACSEGRWVLALTQLPTPLTTLPTHRAAVIATDDLTGRHQLGQVLDELKMRVDIALGHRDTGIVEPERYLPELLLRTSC